MGFSCNLHEDKIKMSPREKNVWGHHYHCFHSFMYLLEIHIISQLHILGVNSEDFQASCCIWDTNVDFTIKATCDKQTFNCSGFSPLYPDLGVHVFTTIPNLCSMDQQYQS